MIKNITYVAYVCLVVASVGLIMHGFISIHLTSYKHKIDCELAGGFAHYGLCIDPNGLINLKKDN